jgi:hypothetical protein
MRASWARILALSVLKKNHLFAVSSLVAQFRVSGGSAGSLGTNGGVVTPQGIVLLCDAVNRAYADVLGVFLPVRNVPRLCGLARKHLANVRHAFLGGSCGVVVKVRRGHAQTVN